MLKIGQTMIRWAFVAALGTGVFAPGAFAQAAPPAATITITDSIFNGGGVLPLSRYIPLFRI